MRRTSLESRNTERKRKRNGRRDSRIAPRTRRAGKTRRYDASAIPAERGRRGMRPPRRQLCDVVFHVPPPSRFYDASRGLIAADAARKSRAIGRRTSLGKFWEAEKERER